MIFHTLLLVENGLISDRRLRTGEPSHVGLVFSTKGVSLRKKPVRLTQEGHDFAHAINQKNVLAMIKKELAEAPFEITMTVSKQWVTKLFNDK